jgi:hypothetical protein
MTFNEVRSTGRALTFAVLIAVGTAAHADRDAASDNLTFLDCSGTSNVWNETWGDPSQLPHRFVVTIDPRAKTLSANFVHLNNVQGTYSESPELYAMSKKFQNLDLFGKQVSRLDFVINRVTGEGYAHMLLADEGENKARVLFEGSCELAKRRF